MLSPCTYTLIALACPFLHSVALAGPNRRSLDNWASAFPASTTYDEDFAVDDYNRASRKLHLANENYLMNVLNGFVAEHEEWRLDQEKRLKRRQAASGAAQVPLTDCEAKSIAVMLCWLKCSWHHF